MRHRLATIYYNLAKNYESDNDLERDLDLSLNKAMEYYQLSQGFANKISVSYRPEVDVYTIEETRADIKNAIKGIKNLLNYHDSELEGSQSTTDRPSAKKNSIKKDTSKPELRSLVAPNNDIAGGLSNLSSFADNLRQNPDDSKLWRHQQECLINTSTILNSGEKYGYINMATGTGKTKVFSNLVTTMGMETIILAPTTILVEQTAKEIQKIAPHLDIGMIDSTHKRKGANITVTTYASFERMYYMDAFKNTKMIILDEAHSSLSERRVNAIKSFQQPSLSTLDTSQLTATNSSSSSSDISLKSIDTNQEDRSKSPIIIGFTATDRFNSVRKAKDFTEVNELLPNKFFEYSIGQGINDKVLHSCKIVELELDDKINQDFLNIIRKRKKKSSTATDEITAADLELLKATEINRILPDLLGNIKDPEDGNSYKDKPGLVFAIDISHAQAIEEEINRSLGEGYAASIHSKMSKTDQAETLRKHRSGEIKTLVNVDMLTVGYDDKKLEYIIDFRPTKSSVRLTQTFGRLTRKDNDNPIAKTYIQLIIPNMNMKASDLFSGETRLGDITPSSSPSMETTEEINVGTHCYYKLKFPYTGPDIERALESKNTLTINPTERKGNTITKKTTELSIVDDDNDLIDYDDLLMLQDILGEENDGSIEIDNNPFYDPPSSLGNSSMEVTAHESKSEIPTIDNSWGARFPSTSNLPSENSLKRDRSSSFLERALDSGRDSPSDMVSKLKKERSSSPTNQMKH
jgi:superfamily II DNA or RNA helicase